MTADSRGGDARAIRNGSARELLLLTANPANSYRQIIEHFGIPTTSIGPPALESEEAAGHHRAAGSMMIRGLAAPPSLVFDALVTPSLLPQLLHGPAGWRLAHLTSPAQQG